MFPLAAPDGGRLRDVAARGDGGAEQGQSSKVPPDGYTGVVLPSLSW